MRLRPRTTPKTRLLLFQNEVHDSGGLTVERYVVTPVTIRSYLTPSFRNLQNTRKNLNVRYALLNFLDKIDTDTLLATNNQGGHC